MGTRLGQVLFSKVTAENRTKAVLPPGQLLAQAGQQGLWVGACMPPPPGGRRHVANLPVLQECFVPKDLTCKVPVTKLALIKDAKLTSGG